jgi:hypothetical protein
MRCLKAYGERETSFTLENLFANKEIALVESWFCAWVLNNNHGVSQDIRLHNVRTLRQHIFDNRKKLFYINWLGYIAFKTRR